MNTALANTALASTAFNRLSCAILLKLLWAIFALLAPIRPMRACAQDSSAIRAATKFGAPPTSAVETTKQAAEDEGWSNVWKNMKTSFALPVEDFAKKKSALEGLSGNVTFWLPLPVLANPAQAQQGQAVGGGTQGPPPADMLVFASLYYFPVGYWFVNVSLFQYINRAQSLPWQPDFTYSFGYNDWHPYTFSLIYGNYGGNKFAPDASKGEAFTRFDEGTWSLGWKFPAPKVLDNLVALHSTSGLGHQINLNLTPRYWDVQSAQFQAWKTSLSLQTRYTIYQYFYALCTVFYYPDARQQQPWDPDFTYGFGYYDWHSFTVSVQYNNYSGNRFPWNRPQSDTGRFLDGVLTLSLNVAF